MYLNSGGASLTLLKGFNNTVTIQNTIFIGNSNGGLHLHLSGIVSYGLSSNTQTFKVTLGLMDKLEGLDIPV